MFLAAVKKAHFDDDIDYYEANSNFNFKALKLNKPIYPISGFIYTGTDNEKIMEYLERFYTNKKLKFGEVIEGNKLNTLLYILNNKVFDGNKFYKEIRKTKSFHPNIDTLALIIAKASDILLENIDEFNFKINVEPTIVTTWG